MPPKSFRPMLEVLEGRVVPSSMARILGQEVADGQLSLTAAAALGEVKLPASATIDFTPFAGIHKKTTVQIRIWHEGWLDRVRKGNIKWDSPVITVAATDTESPLNARTVALDVLAAMPISTVGADGKHTVGFDAVLDSTVPKITIRGWYDAKGKLWDIREPEVGKVGIVPDVKYFEPLIHNDGSDPAVYLPKGKAAAFSFKPDFGDHNATLQEDTVVQGDIDGGRSPLTSPPVSRTCKWPATWPRPLRAWVSRACGWTGRATWSS